MKNLDYRVALTEWTIGLRLNDREKALEYAEKILPEVLARAIQLEKTIDAVKDYLAWYFKTHDSESSSFSEVKYITDICRALEMARLADVYINKEARA